MKTILLMNFSVDKENKKIKVEREFAAPATKVWAAWTQSEVLDKWWAPKPWKTNTKSMDFKEGGVWLYAMVGPDGSRHLCRVDFKSIINLKSYSGLDAFCNEDGSINEELPKSMWEVKFRDNSGSTIVNIETEYQKLEDLEKIIEMGFKEGFTSALENLDELFENKLI